MPWTPLILITVLSGVVSGNRILDSRLRGSYAQIRNAEIATPNIDRFGKSTKVAAILGDDQEQARRHFYSLDAKFLMDLYGLSKCDQSDGTANSNQMDADGCDAYSSRDTLWTNSRDSNDAADEMDGFFGVHEDAARTQLRDKVATTVVANELEPELLAWPASHYEDYYKDTLNNGGSHKGNTKRGGVAPVIGCDCKIKNDLIDLGQQHFPRYLLNAVCQTEQSPNEYPQKCWRGAYCKPLEYKVKVLTFRTIMDHGHKDTAMAWLPDDLRQLWKFKTVTVAAGCFCSY